MVDVNLVGTGVDGEERAVAVGTRSFLQVGVQEGDPPGVGVSSRFRYFSQLFDTTGDGTGSSDQIVDGSATAVTFKVSAAEDYDIKITRIVVFVGDAAITHDKFGGLAALGTGWDLQAVEAGATTAIIDKAKTVSDIIVQGTTALAWGDSATSFELTNYSSTNDAIVVVIPVSDAVPGGIRIGRGTKDQLQCVVNDALAGLTTFTVRAIGYRHYP